MTPLDAILYLRYLDKCPELSSRVWELIDTKAHSALSSELFLRLDVEAVEHILLRETLDIDEFALFRRVVEWIDARSADTETKPPRSAVGTDRIGALLSSLRYLYMNRAEFEDGPARMLSEKQVHDVSKWFATGVKPEWCVDRPRLRRSALRTCWTHRPFCDSSAKVVGISFVVDQPVFIEGVNLRLQGSHTDFEAEIRLETQDGVLMAKSSSKDVQRAYTEPPRLSFDSPFMVKPEQPYLLTVTMKTTGVYLRGSARPSKSQKCRLDKDTSVLFKFFPKNALPQYENAACLSEINFYGVIPRRRKHTFEKQRRGFFAGMNATAKKLLHS